MGLSERIARLEARVSHRPTCDMWDRIRRYEAYFSGEQVELSAESRARLAEHDRYFEELN
jgi:hypothetical protein